jgi:uncharacterized protein
MCNLTLSLLPDTLTICRLTPDAPIPHWALTGSFFSITRTADELSIVCPQSNAPPAIQCDQDWRCLKIEGPLDLSLIGILASLTVPLARAGIGIFAVSTYDTDYVLVKEKHLEEAVLVLSQEGHHVRQ